MSYEQPYEKLQTYFYFIIFQQSPELTKNNKIDHQPKNKNGTNGHDNNILNNKKNSLGSKFQDVQRKWMSPQPPSIGDSDLESELRNLSSGPSSLPLGHSSVKSLSHKFQQNGNGNGHSPQNGQNGYVFTIYFSYNKGHKISEAIFLASIVPKNNLSYVIYALASEMGQMKKKHY